MKLKQLRRSKLLTQRDLAKKLNVTVTTVAYWETNVSNPSLSNIKKLQDFFGEDAISINDFTS